MLLLVATLGGLLLMMGHHACSESLFYYLRIEDQVPENHLLRIIDRRVSFQFVRDELRDSYSEAGRNRTYLYRLPNRRYKSGTIIWRSL